MGTPYDEERVFRAMAHNPLLDPGRSRGSLSRMKHVGVVLGGLVSSLTVFACGSSPLPDPGVNPPTQSTDCSTSDKNPYGACYPTTDIGTGVRTGQGASAVAGSRIANFAFTGYAAADSSSVLATTATKTVHLGDYFDPQQKLGAGGTGIKIIQLVVSAVWCGPCNEETDFVSGANYTGANTAGASWAKELESQGVVFVQALDDGAVVGVGATLTDLNGWINHHQNDFTTMLDPGNQNLGVFFDAAAIPFNATIDARSMEILEAGVGFDTNEDTTLKNWVTWVGKNAAKQ
jgi:hypothetical protein